MTDAPEEIHIKPNRDYTSIWGRPVVTDPFDDDPETAAYIRADIHDAAVSAARKEGMREAAQIADRHYANGDMGNPGHHIMQALEATP